MAATVKVMNSLPPIDPKNFDVWWKFFKGYLMTQKPDNLETAFDEVNEDDIDENEMRRITKL